MKTQIKVTTAILIFIAVSYMQTLNAQITRGHEAGELYIPSIWYEPGYEERYDAIFYTSDNGETLGIKYVCDVYSFQDMQIQNLVSDATPAVLYNYFQHNLSVSFDSGVTWDSLDPLGVYSKFTSGCDEGEIYELWVNENAMRVELNRSTDYGQNFILINENTGGGSKVEVGSEAGEVYLIYTPDPLEILFSNNNGVDFTLQSELDTTIGGYVVNGHYPVISRSTSPGELYLVSWHYPANYHIYHSIDYGQSFNLRYISDECDLIYIYKFTAGIEPGSFYMSYSIPWYDGINTLMYIYYSNDTAKTFTEYVHILDENFPVSIQENNNLFENIQLSQNYPNPFSTSTNIEFNISKESKIEINVYNINGQLVIQLLNKNLPAGQHNISWDGTNETGQQLKSGIYFYRLKTDEGVFRKKMVLVR
ncbi:MAG: T9SS type A sorting domain-containing protein [Bacteroidales bacterium]|nr:T9SS type A sorting domain-containing protein [Bacteroidales bacterium]